MKPQLSDRTEIMSRSRHIVMEEARKLTREDLRLFARHLDEWGEKNPAPAPEVGGLMRFLRGAARADMLDPLLCDLLWVSSTSSDISVLDEAAEYLPNLECVRENVDWFEGYARFLKDQGYSGLAVRMWRMCQVDGRIPDHIQARIDVEEDNQAGPGLNT